MNKNNLPCWKTFSNFLKKGKNVKDFGFLCKNGELSRINARYKMIKNFESILFNNYSINTIEKYNSLFKIFLAYSLFENYLKNGLGIKNDYYKMAGDIISKKYPTLSEQLLKLDKNKKFYSFLLTYLNSKHRNNIENFYNKKEHNVIYLISAIRHVFAHGILVANNIIAPKKLTNLIVNNLLDYIKDDFALRICSKICVLTTIFPMDKKYLYDFFDSLSNQTYKNFDIIVVNDGYNKFDEIKEKYKNLNIIELKYSSTPAKNREYGINYCIDKKYNFLIFGDSDDYFSENRIEKNLEKLQQYDIVVNDLTLFNDKGIICNNYFSNRLKNNFIFDYKFIKDKNICGLSNTALNLKILSNIEFPEDIIAVDWYLFKKILKKNKAVFTNETTTYYRQYENNTLGLKNDKKYLFWHEGE